MRRHLFVCTNTLASGKPACGQRGGDAIARAVQTQLIARGASALVTPCGCLGPCFDGPNAVVYPDGVWYGGLDEHAIELVPDLEDALDRGLALTPPGGELVLLPTYTAMLGLQRLLAARGLARPYWERTP